MSDDEAFYREFLAPVERRLLRTVHRVLGDPEEARDTLQDALVRIWHRRDRVRAHPNPEALIMRIGLQVAIDALRRRRRRPAAGGSAPEAIPDPDGRGPLARLERREAREAVLDAIGKLPRQQAVAALMRVVEEEPYAVIARALGCAEITARTHVVRARSRLARLLAHLRPCSPRAGGAG